MKEAREMSIIRPMKDKKHEGSPEVTNYDATHIFEG
ncbi:hypothetical protein J2Y67_003195 [Neobacillus niacini]|nr:hypothetical protein [Neobacillus niacini]